VFWPYHKGHFWLCSWCHCVDELVNMQRKGAMQQRPLALGEMDASPVGGPDIFPVKQAAIQVEEAKKHFRESRGAESHRGTGVSPQCCMKDPFYLFLWYPEK
jgi:hypothetical protein